MGTAKMDTEDALKNAYEVLRYALQALPIHSSQMAAIIRDAEKNNLILGENFSNLIDEIGMGVRKSNEIKDKILASDLSDKHFDSIRGMLDELMDQANSVHTSVSEIMVSLQYEDSTRQVLSHVQENLSDICTEISNLGDEVKMVSAEDKEKLVNRISSLYTMAQEREIFTQVTGVDSVKSCAKSYKQEDDEVTFF